MTLRYKRLRLPPVSLSERVLHGHPSPHPLLPHNHPHCISNEDSHPPACTPSWESEVSSIVVSGELPPIPHSPLPLFLPLSPHTSPRLRGITSIWPTFRPRSISSCTLSICCFLVTQPYVFLLNPLFFSRFNPDIVQLQFDSQALVFLYVFPQRQRHHKWPPS